MPPAVSAIIPTWKRLDDLPKTLACLYACDPKPEEVVIHIDAGDNKTEPYLKENWPQVRILKSTERQGPGGSRNKLLDAVTQPFVASFDDDSYPLDPNYFQRIQDAFERHPEAGMLSSTVYHRGEQPAPPEASSTQVVNFMGCGCAYRLEAWNQTDGYLPRTVPYGIEEIDVALQLLENDWSIIHDRRLRIMHDTTLTHHDDPFKTAGAIVNRLLLAWVRYPASYLWLGLGQYISRIVWSIRAGRRDGVLTALRQTPGVLWTYRHHRNPVSGSTLREARRLQANAASQ